MFRREGNPNVEMLKITKKTIYILYTILTITCNNFPTTIAAPKGHLTDDVIHSMIHSKSGQQPRGYAYQFTQLCHLMHKLSKTHPNYEFCTTTLPPPTTTPSKNLAHLINGHGKCMDTSDDLSGNGERLIQYDCEPKETKQMWSWNDDTLGSNNQHMCNGFDMCADSPDDNSNITSLIPSDFIADEPGQKFHFLNSSRPAFYMINDDVGNCIGVDEDSEDNGAGIVAEKCDASQNGQYWQWHKI